MLFGTLYTHKPNPRSFAILAVAQAQGLELEIVDASRENAENHARLLKVNPLGQVPVLVTVDGYVLTECIPIALYITSQSDTTTLLGATRRDYYDILRWMSRTNSDLLPAIGGVILPLLGRDLAVRKNSQDCLRAVYANCQLLDSHLAREGRRYLVGDALTLGDLFTAGCLVFAFAVFHRRLREDYPALTEWFLRVYHEPMFLAVAGELRLLDIPTPALDDAER